MTDQRYKIEINANNGEVAEQVLWALTKEIAVML